jgi:cytochrome c oxidase assembly protein subunit 15
MDNEVTSGAATVSNGTKSVRLTYSSKPPAFADILAIGFATSLTMWLVGYLCLLPGAGLRPMAIGTIQPISPLFDESRELVPPAIVLPLLLAFQAMGGFAAGRLTRRGLRGGLYVGLLSAVVNLLVLGSLLGGDDPDQLGASAAWWIPGSLTLGAVLGVVGAGLAIRPARKVIHNDAWTSVFARVDVVGTLWLILVGGLVTSNQAGLAVVDWPNSFGYKMFLYPLSRMTGGVYFEHAHRLAGSLVGLTTLVLAIHTQVAERRRWVRHLAWCAFTVVVAQGILGGLRVTGHFTLSSAQTDPNESLALVHAVVAQAFLALLVTLSVVTSRAWKQAGAVDEASAGVTDRHLIVTLLALLVVQLVLGTFLRHTGRAVMAHVFMATLVLFVALTVGLRARYYHHDRPKLPQLGTALVILVVLQIALGLAALTAWGLHPEGTVRPAWDAIVRTAHQVTGAVIVATAVSLAIWTFRLFSHHAVSGPWHPEGYPGPRGQGERARRS